MARIRRQIITIDEEKCDGCGNCVPSCAEGALQVVNGKARLVRESYCDGLGACLGECPRGALAVVEMEADAFDEAEALAHLRETPSHPAAEPLAAAIPLCPSVQLRGFAAPGPSDQAPARAQSELRTPLRRWLHAGRSP